MYAFHLGRGGTRRRLFCDYIKILDYKYAII